MPGKKGFLLAATTRRYSGVHLLRYWPGQGLVYVCPLLFVCVTGMRYFRVTLLKASVLKRGYCEAIK